MLETIQLAKYQEPLVASIEAKNVIKNLSVATWPQQAIASTVEALRGLNSL